MPENAREFGPLQKLMDDPEISEIMVNGPEYVFIEKHGKRTKTDVKFGSEEEVLKLIQGMYSLRGKRVDKDVPYADVCLEDGTRVNTIISPISRFGIAVTFRKFSKEINSLDDLVKKGTLNQRAADLLVAAVKGKINILFSGGTGVGKTTLLQMLSRYFAGNERVITIEDAAELKLDQENVISLETRTPDRDGKGGISLRDLIRNALRMSPNRIVVGEVRGAEAIDMLQAMAVGHTGTIGIIHGNSARDVIARLETMVLMSGINLPLWEIRKLIASTVNMVVHIEKMKDGVRRVTHITEIRGLDREEIQFNDLFMFETKKVEPDGSIIGELKPAIRYFPLFFQQFQKLGLLSEKIFSNE
ncbi:MAG: CpaF family protein [Candidatus Omnitrophica bacterium]|nr:CpaF family protein [Candidatus Omnitrophota bacterium]